MRWAPIVGYEGIYEVSDEGDVRRIAPGKRTRPGRVLIGKPLQGKYRNVKLYRDGRFRTFSVHGLVAAAFLGPRPPGLEINHKDTVKSNNRADNLEYTTRLGNAQHAVAGGCYRKGSAVIGSKLTDDDVRALRALRTCGWTYAKLKIAFGVSHGTIGPILTREWWKHV
jgi:hypothetical protein